MNLLRAALLVCLAAPLACVAAEQRTSLSPKPRARLQLGTATPTVRIEPGATALAPPLVMNRVVVSEARLPEVPRTVKDEERTTFSALRGGPVLQRKVGSTVIEAGVWPWTDIMDGETPLPLRARAGHASVAIFRVRW